MQVCGLYDFFFFFFYYAYDIIHANHITPLKIRVPFNLLALARMYAARTMLLASCRVNFAGAPMLPRGNKLIKWVVLRAVPVTNPILVVMCRKTFLFILKWAFMRLRAHSSLPLQLHNLRHPNLPLSRHLLLLPRRLVHSIPVFDFVFLTFC